MIPPLDVFSVKHNATRWLGAAENLARAFDMIRRNGAGSYFVFSQRTGHKNFYELDRMGQSERAIFRAARHRTRSYERGRSGDAGTRCRLVPPDLL